MCRGYVQANVIMLPNTDAFDFLRFCVQNAAACPVLEVTAPGQWEPVLTAPGSDLRTDVGRYEVHRDGVRTEVRTDVCDVVDDHMCSFLLGCSYTFEHVLVEARIPMRHQEQRIDGAPMFRTNRSCVPAGRFHGELVVTMRPIPHNRISETVRLTAAHPEAHGAPVSVGCPEALGIMDLNRPDWGSPVALSPGDVPVFWACGVTATNILRNAQLAYAITHSSGFMFITDVEVTP
ncbi:DUF1445 domain-containing protein [Mycolicibacterium madagascariense]|nr:DUF1445 domain-containing protein [Mycolicibacterium madagascariense]